MNEPTAIDRQQKVALIWPGGVFGPEGNFGVPQMLSLASALTGSGHAKVTIYDLDAEIALGGLRADDFRRERYDVVAISCYSSYDYLKVLSLATWLRTLADEAAFVVGGYHPSARPEDFLLADSPFDYVVVGEGEQALTELVRLRRESVTPPHRILLGTASAPVATRPHPFELLDRYRSVFATVASRFELYLSRGCPYGCSFCMERSKRTVTWRSLSVDDAIEQLERLEDFVDLRGKTLRIADALFGMHRHWRREFLERLAQRPLVADKVWLLTRADLLEEDDFRLMARANVAPGFGLESGDPEILRSTGKLRGNVQRFLERLFDVAEWGRKYNVPFGANVIVGLPGETEASLRRTARYLDELFLGDLPTVGFFGIDRFRLYPGSAIAQNFASWQERTGCVAHRPRWWFDGDQDFLSEWIDPSRELDFEQSMETSFELFGPRLAELERRFAYHGSAREKFLGTIHENLESWLPPVRQRQRELAAIWHPLKGIECETVEPLSMFTG